MRANQRQLLFFTGCPDALAQFSVKFFRRHKRPLGPRRLRYPGRVLKDGSNHTHEVMSREAVQFSKCGGTHKIHSPRYGSLNLSVRLVRRHEQFVFIFEAERF